MALLALAVVALACGGEPGARAAPERAVYALLLEQVEAHRAGTLVAREFEPLAESALEVDALAEWAATERPGTDPDLVRAIAAPRESAAARTLAELVGDGRGVRWADSALVARVRAQPREAGRLLALSRVGFSADSTRAAVYVAEQCGELCGVGELYLLRRTRRGGWRVEGKLVRWSA